MLQARSLVVAACWGALLCSASVRADDLQIDAETMTVRGERETAPGPDIVAEGNVLVRRGGLQLRAPRLEIDRAGRVGLLSGGVVGVEGLVVFAARTLRFDAAAGTQTLDAGTILIKKGVTADDLLAGVSGPDPGCVRRAGGNALTLRASELRRQRDGTLDATGVWFTNCACGEDCRPLLSVSAASAHIRPNDRASFAWPMLRLFDVPVLPLPWISLPLTNRQTGMLFPIVGFNGPGGINVGVPVFITLGESADLTVEPLYYFGTINANAGGSGSNSAGVKGFGGDLELRWRPAEDSSGSVHMLYLYDWSRANVGTGPRGNRGLVEATHIQGLLGGRLGANINLTSDSNVRSDSAVPVQWRYQQYLRSSAEFTRVLGPIGLSFESVFLEDLQSQDCAQDQTCYPRTPLWQIPGAIAPVARLNLGADNRLGRVAMNEQLDLAVEDTWRGLPSPVRAHTRRISAGLSLAQSLPLLGGNYGSVSLDAGERAQWLGLPGGSGQNWRAGGYAGLLARTRVARTFESGWTHDIVPAIRVRGLGSAGSYSFSRGVDADLLGASPLPQSGWDLALPAAPVVQTIASLSTSLTPPKGEPMIVSIEQHLAALPFDAGQLRLWLEVPWQGNRVRLAASRVFSAGLTGWGPASLEYQRQFGSDGDLDLRVAFNDGRTDDQIARGPDLLFTPRSEVPPTTGLHPPQSSYQAHAGVTLRHVGPIALGLRGDLTYYPNATQSLVHDYKITASYEVEGCGTVRLTIGWTWAAQQGTQQPLPLPIPSPEYLFGDTSDITRGVASALGSN